eukprot:gene11526-21735_t
MVRLCNFVRLALIGLAVVDGLDHKLGGHGRAECHKEDVCHKKGGKHGNTYDCAKAIDLKDCVTVDLTHLDFGDAGAITLAAALKESTVVEQLFIPYNEIEEDGAAAILKVVESHPSLERLFMYNNKYVQLCRTAAPSLACTQ